MELKKPKVYATRVLHEARKLKLIEEDLEFPDGHKETWEHVVLKEPGAKVLAVTDNDELIMVREYRGAAGEYVLRIPTGAIEPGEKPDEAAVRELQEEVGYFPQTLEFIEEQKPMSTFFKAYAFIFYATNLQKKSLERDAGEQDMQVAHIPLEKVYEMIFDMEISDPQTIYAILRLRKHLKDKTKNEG
ncbi:NUDIX domain-containing protein [Candidatus Uabimicrobium amorphum]|uniref:GDP-mannose pyrophosphatase n=1 Tax=Uabimicrobium amorphum TaxID=2596890 RepID=A0A5S9IN55_UABAM|nr:NUDIX domain-containing protein [Candidatus Uabimicrobium amorphum]BBM84929.1 ADP-ribose pyrophosphatase [Candidatus Uabimicrobium amorphum]